MIISHKHKFIFLKTRKTAGSSIQVALAEHCGDDDVITGQYRLGIDDNIHSTGLNYDKYNFVSPYDPHTVLKEVKTLVGSDIWNSYFKFAFVRNPYEIAVSRYHWNKKGKSDTPQETSIEGFREWVRNGNIPNFDKFKNYIYDDGAIDIDFVGMYENLEEDMDYICKRIGIPKLNLPKLKAGFRDNTDFKDHYDDVTRNITYQCFKEDIELFGYTFDNKNIISKRNPIVYPGLFDKENNNINNPSIIKVPDWVSDAKGKYYCYFSNHNGQSIKLAYTDDLEGNWTVIDDIFHIDSSPCTNHIASPEVLIDNKSNKILMYYHGGTDNGQKTFLASSIDGLNFTSDTKPLCDFYLRVFEYNNKKYGIAKKGNECSVVYDVDNDFKPIFEFLPSSRHCATYVKDENLYVFYSNIGDTPEHIRVCKIKLASEVVDWDVISDKALITPTFRFEGAHLSNVTSMPGSATNKFGHNNIKEIRDPYLFEDGGKLYLYYVILGEKQISWCRVINLD